MGLASLNALGTQGALFQVVSHGLIAALLPTGCYRTTIWNFGHYGARRTCEKCTDT